MTHLTLTGYYAGTLICGESRAEARGRGDQTVHATYAPDALFKQGSDLCPQCRAEWDAAADDEGDE